MSYCRFRNTKSDLMDCKEALFNECTPEESRARAVLIKICHDIAKDVPMDEIENLPIEK